MPEFVGDLKSVGLSLLITGSWVRVPSGLTIGFRDVCFSTVREANRVTSKHGKACLERRDVDQRRSESRRRGRTVRIGTNTTDVASGEGRILRKRLPSFGFPIQDRSPSPNHRVDGYLARAMAVGEPALGDAASAPGLRGGPQQTGD